MAADNTCTGVMRGAIGESAITASEKPTPQGFLLFFFQNFPWFPQD